MNISITNDVWTMRWYSILPFNASYTCSSIINCRTDVHLKGKVKSGLKTSSILVSREFFFLFTYIYWNSICKSKSLILPLQTREAYRDCKETFHFSWWSHLWRMQCFKHLHIWWYDCELIYGNNNLILLSYQRKMRDTAS